MTEARIEIDRQLLERLFVEGSSSLIVWASPSPSADHEEDLTSVRGSFYCALELIVWDLWRRDASKTYRVLKSAGVWNLVVARLNELAEMSDEKRSLAVQALQVHLSLRKSDGM